ncbi:hypothetical protein NLG97_g9333 [Lecanicillium saksenae]|uniref:Uncharacterized protein n=1 Tax=Lecanicillium saksenae TaxID=468837 RepID=A0ACC1QJA7_9HYPO|nr:hypothetical protein NLG97_g9333 [Lecanicillium saksenae]
MYKGARATDVQPNFVRVLELLESTQSPSAAKTRLLQPMAHGTRRFCKSVSKRAAQQNNNKPLTLDNIFPLYFVAIVIQLGLFTVISGAMVTPATTSDTPAFLGPPVIATDAMPATHQYDVYQ